MSTHLTEEEVAPFVRESRAKFQASRLDNITTISMNQEMARRLGHFLHDMGGSSGQLPADLWALKQACFDPNRERDSFEETDV